MARLRTIFNTAKHRIHALADPLGPVNGMFRILKQEGLPGLAFYIKDRLGVRARFLIITLLLILPAVLALWFIKHYAVNVCAFDDIDEARLFGKLYTGHLSFGDLFALHNEHRIFMARIAFLLFGVLTHLNEVDMCYFSWFLMCLTCFVFYLALVRIFTSRETALVALIPIVWVMFGLRQTENLIHGGNSFTIFVILFFLLAIYFLATSTGLRWRFALSVACGVLSTYSMANGLLVWPIGLIVMLWIRQSHPKEMRRSYLRMAAIWCLVGIAVFLAYFISSPGIGGPSKTEFLLQHPLSALRYFVLAMGSLMYYKYPAYIFGLLLLPLFAFVLVTIVFQTKARLSTALSLSLILFGVSSAVLLAWSRLPYGSEEALVGRYTTYTNPAIVGLYMGIISLKTKHIDVKPFLVGFLTSLMVLGLAVSSITAVKIEAPKWTGIAKWQAYFLSTYRVQSDENINSLCPWDLHVAREGAEILEKYRLSVFSGPSLKPDDLIPVAGSTEFGIESINDLQLSQQNPGIINLSLQKGTLTIWGWAVDQEAKNTAGAVFISIDGQIDIPAWYGWDRPDIAARFGESRYRFSGFMASFATSVVGEGQHTLSLKIVTADKKRYYEPDQKIVLEVT